MLSKQWTIKKSQHNARGNNNTLWQKWKADLKQENFSELSNRKDAE